MLQHQTFNYKNFALNFTLKKNNKKKKNQKTLIEGIHGIEP